MNLKGDHLSVLCSQLVSATTSGQKNVFGGLKWYFSDSVMLKKQTCSLTSLLFQELKTSKIIWDIFLFCEMSGKWKMPKPQMLSRYILLYQTSNCQTLEPVALNHHSFLYLHCVFSMLFLEHPYIRVCFRIPSVRRRTALRSWRRHCGKAFKSQQRGKWCSLRRNRHA